jgi:hypothetical protein
MHLQSMFMSGSNHLSLCHLLCDGAPVQRAQQEKRIELCHLRRLLLPFIGFAIGLLSRHLRHLLRCSWRGRKWKRKQRRRQRRRRRRRRRWRLIERRTRGWWRWRCCCRLFSRSVAWPCLLRLFQRLGLVCLPLHASGPSVLFGGRGAAREASVLHGGEGCGSGDPLAFVEAQAHYPNRRLLSSGA